MPGLMKQKPRGLFGSAASTMPDQPAMTATAQPMAPKKGFDWKKALGVLGDSLSISGGGQAQYVPNLIDQRNRREAQAYAEQLYQRRRGDTLADQRSLLEYKRANPDPDYFDDNAGNRWSINPSTGEKKLIFRDPNAKRIPQKTYGPNGEEYIEYVEIPNMVNEDGTVRAAIAPQASPQRPKGKLTPYNGGPTPSASGNFR